MPKFGPFERALGEQLFKLGNGYGACMMVSRIKHAAAIDAQSVQRELARFMDLPEVVSERGGLGAQAELNAILKTAFPAMEKSDSSVRKVIYGETAFEGAAAL